MGHEIVKPVWDFEELESIQLLNDRQRYSSEDIDRIFDLYNRVNDTHKKPTGCGKCIVNALESLRRRYDAERQQRNQG
jgi:hypothetical protein